MKAFLKEDLCYKTIYMLSIISFTALLLLVSETISFMSNNYYTSYAVPEKATTAKLPLIGSETFLNVVTQVDNTNGGTKKPSDFAITVTGNSPSPSSFSGSSSGTSVTLKDGKYSVTSSSPSGYSPSYSSGCSGTASGGEPIKCNITNKYTPLPGSETFLNVVTQVDNTNGGTKKPSDFAITVTGNSPSPSSFSGSSSGTSVTLKDGKYSVTSSSPSGYSPSLFFRMLWYR